MFHFVDGALDDFPHGEGALTGLSVGHVDDPVLMRVGDEQLLLRIPVDLLETRIQTRTEITFVEVCEKKAMGSSFPLLSTSYTDEFFFSAEAFKRSALSAVLSFFFDV